MSTLNLLEVQEYNDLRDIVFLGLQDVLGEFLYERYKDLAARYSIAGIVRRMMPSLIAHDICGVQPMTGPTGLVYALKHQYGSKSSLKVADDVTT